MDGVNVGRMEIRKEIFGFARRVIPFFRTSVASCDVCPANLFQTVFLRQMMTKMQRAYFGIFYFFIKLER